MNIVKFVVNQYSKMTKPAKASIWFMFASMLNKGIAFITTPLFTRLLTQEEFGIISLYNTWLSLLTIVVTLNLATGVFNKAMVKYDNDRDGYTSSSLFLMTCLTICCFIIYFSFHNFWNKLFGLNTKIMLMMFLEILCTTTWEFYLIRNRFDFKYRTIVRVTISSNILATIFSLFLVIKIAKNRVMARIFGIVIIHALLYSIVYIKIIFKGKKIIAPTYWKYSLLYNLPLVPHYLSQQILNQCDRIMISNMCDNVSAGIYSLAYQLAAVMQIITNAIHASFMPWCFQIIKSDNVKLIGKRAYQIELIIGLMCVIFSLFAPEFIYILGGKQYYSAVYIIPPVSMSVLFLTIYSFFGNIEFYFEKTKIVMVASCVVAVSNIALNALFINIYGFVAAGYTTLVCYIGYALIHYFFMRKICLENDMHNPFPGKKMWIVALIYAGVSVCISFFYSYNLIRYILIVVLFTIAVWYFIRNKNSFLGKE